MKKLLITMRLAVTAYIPLSASAETQTATASLTEAVNLFIGVAGNKALTLDEKKVRISCKTIFFL